MAKTSKDSFKKIVKFDQHGYQNYLYFGPELVYVIKPSNENFLICMLSTMVVTQAKQTFFYLPNQT
jgi:hypothetical protein